LTANPPESVGIRSRIEKFPDQTRVRLALIYRSERKRPPRFG